MSNDYGNPSLHIVTDEMLKSILGLSRESIAKHFNVSAQELFSLAGETIDLTWLKPKESSLVN
jgi:hypothetical protein